MMTTAAVWGYLVMTATRNWFTERLDTTAREETGSATLETVVIAAGLLALAVGLVVVIKVAVSHYASEIN